MKSTNKDQVKVQSFVEGIPADIYRLIPRGMKNVAITHALLLLANDKKNRSIFFGKNEGKVEAVLNKDINNKSEKQQSLTKGKRDITNADMGSKTKNKKTLTDLW